LSVGGCYFLAAPLFRRQPRETGRRPPSVGPTTSISIPAALDPPSWPRIIHEPGGGGVAGPREAGRPPLLLLKLLRLPSVYIDGGDRRGDDEERWPALGDARPPLGLRPTRSDGRSLLLLLPPPRG